MNTSLHDTHITFESIFVVCLVKFGKLKVLTQSLADAFSSPKHTLKFSLFSFKPNVHCRDLVIPQDQCRDDSNTLNSFSTTAYLPS